MLTEQRIQAEAAPRFTHRQVLEILAGLMLAMLTSMISTSVVGTALPTIVGTLGGQEQLAWVAGATLLTMTASTPIWGKLSDLYGRKLMFQVSLVVFVLSSIAAGFSQDMGQLIAARALQGIGAGGLAALPQIILGDVVEPASAGATPATSARSSASRRWPARCSAGSSWTTCPGAGPSGSACRWPWSRSSSSRRC